MLQSSLQRRILPIASIKPGKVKVKVKATAEQMTKAKTGGRGIALLFP